MNSNRILIFLGALLLIGLASCQKEDTTSSAPTINTPYSTDAPQFYRGVYVDGYDKMLGDTAKENDLLRWCKRNRVNTLTVYTLNNILPYPSKFPLVASFVSRSKITYGIKIVSASFSSVGKFETLLTQYDSSCVTNFQRFNCTNLELEWWNNACTYSYYHDQLQGIQQWAYNRNSGLLTDTYIGWLRNPTGQELAMATDLVNYTDRILVHDYELIPSFSYIQARLSWIGKSAKAQSKIAQVVVLISTEKNASYTYFTQHTFDDAYNQIAQEWSSSSFEGKDGLQIIGYQLFTQSSARECRP